MCLSSSGVWAALQEILHILWSSHFTVIMYIINHLFAQYSHLLLPDLEALSYQGI